MTAWLDLSDPGTADTLTQERFGRKGSAILRASAAGLPIVPGFVLPVGEALELASLDTLLDQLETKAGAKLGGFGPERMSLYLRVTIPGLTTQRPPSLLHLGLEWRELTNPLEGLAQLAARSLHGLLSSLGNQVLPTLDEYLEDEEIETFVPAQHGPAYRAWLEARAGRAAPQAPRDQIGEALQALRAQVPNSALLMTLMVPSGDPLRSLRARMASRDPESGEGGAMGLRLRSGDPSVSGLSANRDAIVPRLNAVLEGVDQALDAAARTLEKTFGDLVEFDVAVGPEGWTVLNVDPAQRSASAWIKVAADLVHWQARSREAVLASMQVSQLESLLHPRLKASEVSADAEIGRGLPASPGAASGMLIFNPDEAVERAKRGDAVVLVRRETAPEDVRAMASAVGVITMRGGLSSHAAVIARGLGTPAVTGLRGLSLDEDKAQLIGSDMVLSAGQTVSLDGTKGRLYLGRVPTEPPEVSSAFQDLLGWADAARHLEVRANAEGESEARLALEMGAAGIGLCRTEHMLFSPGRLTNLRKLILADTDAMRQDALDQLLVMQREDLAALFRLMGERPLNVRLLDPPLHEFLPAHDTDMQRFAKATGMAVADIRARTLALSEANPMLGHRGCRLGISFPVIYDMQVRAILEAAQTVQQELGLTPRAEIMIPLVSMAGEVRSIRKRIETIAADVAKAGPMPNFEVGSMVETPRACLDAARLAEVSDFFSFGTNDLTQTVYAISRDDAGKFLRAYTQQALMPNDPFSTLDREGVGSLIQEAITRARAVKPNLKIGVCGEHGGDPQSIHMFEELGVDYVSCAPLRLPVARLAAAQAALPVGK